MKNVDSPPSVRADHGLTSREKEVLALAAQGLNRPQIAERLGLRSLTIGSHMKNIFPKLGVHSRTAAVAVALRQGLVAEATQRMSPDSMVRGRRGGFPAQLGSDFCPNCGCSFAESVPVLHAPRAGAAQDAIPSFANGSVGREKQTVQAAVIKTGRGLAKIPRQNA